MKVELEEFRRGFHVGCRVAVVIHSRGEDRERVGVIRGWSWHGRNFSNEDKLPDLYLCADVEFEKVDGSGGTYCRTFDVAGLAER